MMKKFKLLAGIFLVTTMLGCGSASNNDQGVSFSFLGFFQDSAGTIGASGAVFPISGLTNTEPATASDSELLAYIGVQNNLTGQTVRTQRVYLDYVIPGASVNVPSTTVALSVLLGPGTDGKDSTTLPPSVTSIANTKYAQIAIIPNSIREWIVLNRGKLPEPPFSMEIVAYVHGITSAGDALDTNVGSIDVQITPDDVIPPTDGTSSAPA